MAWLSMSSSDGWDGYVEREEVLPSLTYMPGPGFTPHLGQYERGQCSAVDRRATRRAGYRRLQPHPPAQTLGGHPETEPSRYGLRRPSRARIPLSNHRSDSCNGGSVGDQSSITRRSGAGESYSSSPSLSSIPPPERFCVHELYVMRQGKA